MLYAVKTQVKAVQFDIKMGRGRYDAQYLVSAVWCPSRIIGEKYCRALHVLSYSSELLAMFTVCKPLMHQLLKSAF